MTSSLGHCPTSARPASEFNGGPAGQPRTQLLLSMGTYWPGSTEGPDSQVLSDILSEAAAVGERTVTGSTEDGRARVLFDSTD